MLHTTDAAQDASGGVGTLRTSRYRRRLPGGDRLDKEGDHLSAGDPLERLPRNVGSTLVRIWIRHGSHEHRDGSGVALVPEGLGRGRAVGVARP